MSHNQMGTNGRADRKAIISLDFIDMIYAFYINIDSFIGLHIENVNENLFFPRPKIKITSDFK